MTEVRVYDKDLNWVNVTNMCLSIQFKRELYNIGSFELQINLSRKEAIDFCKKGNVVVIDKDFKRVGIINSFRVEENREGATLIVNGYTGNGIAKTRIVVPPTKTEDPKALGYEYVEGDAETVIKHFASKNMTNCRDSKRNVANMVVAQNTKLGNSFKWRARYTNLAEELEQICSYAEMGYHIYMDPINKKWVFDIIRGVDRTREQNEVSPVVFRIEYSNIGEYTYTEDCVDYKNTFYAGGSGTDENRLIYILNTENTGIDREEMFLDISNAKNISDLTFYAGQQAKEFEPKKNIEVLTLPSTFIFEKDYFLGDKVTVYISRLGIDIDTTLTSVTEVWERDVGYNCEIRFGDTIPNNFLINNIKGVID